MINLQKAGGIAALVLATAYIVGFVAMATLLNPGNVEDWTPVQKIELFLGRKALYQSWMILIYVFAGALLVVLSVAFHDRLKTTSAVLMKLTTPFGLIWAGIVIASGMVAIVGTEVIARLYANHVSLAASTSVAINAIHEGLGGGVEFVGGVWVLLIGVATFQSRQLPRPFGYLSLLVGIAGILTVVPALGDLAAVFGLGQILWFAWTGILMLRRNPS